MKTVLISGPVGPIAEAWWARTFFLRLRGLIGRTIPPGGGLLLTPCHQIHTCFMSGPIDAVFVDREGRVLSIQRELAPWRFLSPVAGAKEVLELPPAAAASLGLEVGMMLTRAPR